MDKDKQKNMYVGHLFNKRPLSDYCLSIVQLDEHDNANGIQVKYDAMENNSADYGDDNYDDCLNAWHIMIHVKFVYFWMPKGENQNWFTKELLIFWHYEKERQQFLPIQFEDRHVLLRLIHFILVFL
jgi:hypothetical protein